MFLRIDEVHYDQLRIFGDILIIVGVFDTVQPLDHEIVLQGFGAFVSDLLRTYQNTEVKQRSDFHVIILCPGIPVDC